MNWKIGKNYIQNKKMSLLRIRGIVSKLYCIGEFNIFENG
jgi:hypothetical protein